VLRLNASLEKVIKPIDDSPRVDKKVKVFPLGYMSNITK
jgi:hypothetical protein